jgi:hypothetical protein
MDYLYDEKLTEWLGLVAPAQADIILRDIMSLSVGERFAGFSHEINNRYKLLKESKCLSCGNRQATVETPEEIQKIIEKCEDVEIDASKYLSRNYLDFSVVNPEILKKKEKILEEIARNNSNSFSYLGHHIQNKKIFIESLDRLTKEAMAFNDKGFTERLRLLKFKLSEIGFSCKEIKNQSDFLAANRTCTEYMQKPDVKAC